VVAVLVALQIAARVRPATAKRIVLSDGESTLTIDPSYIELHYRGNETTISAQYLSMRDPSDKISTRIAAGRFETHDGQARGILSVNSDGAMLTLNRGKDSGIDLLAGADWAFVRTDCHANEITAHSSPRGAALFGGKHKPFELGDNRDEVILGNGPIKAQ
jgi:hypothetical protein